MSLNQLLYNGPGIVNHRPWLDVKVNSVQFNVDGNQSVLDFYSAPAAVVPLTFSNSGSTLNFTFSRIGKLVIGSADGTLTSTATPDIISTTGIPTDFRPSASVQFLVTSTIASGFSVNITCDISVAGLFRFNATETAATPIAGDYVMAKSCFCYSV